MRLSTVDAEEQKNRIIESAVELFCTKGYEATKLDDIAKAANISKSPIYNHFENKENLFQVIVNRECDKYEEFERSIFLSDNSVFDKVAAVLYRCTAIGRTMEKLRTQMYFSSDSLTGAKERFRQCQNILIEVKRIAFNQALSMGELRKDCNIDNVIEMIFWFYRGMQAQISIGQTAWDEVHLAEMIREFIRLLKTRYAVL